MKTLKWLAILGAVAVAAFVVGTLTAPVFAQGGPWGNGVFRGMMRGYGPSASQPGAGINGYGMMGGSGMMGGFAPNATQPYSGTNGFGMTLAPHASAGVGGIGNMGAIHQWMHSANGMHTTMWNSLASALKLTPDELNAQLASGKTLAQIAEAQGVSKDQLASTLEASVKAGLDKAVAEQVLTQQQADWMLSHMDGNWEWMITNMGAGTGPGSAGCHGSSTPQKQS